MECLVHRLPMRHPADVGGVLQLIDDGQLLPAEIVAILAKTEGNGCVNDFTRALAMHAFSAALAPLLGIDAADVPDRVAMVMSGGTEGDSRRIVSCSPCATAARHGSGASRWRSAPQGHVDFKPEEIGRTPQVETTAAAVREADNERPDRRRRGYSLGPGQVSAIDQRAHC